MNYKLGFWIMFASWLMVFTWNAHVFHECMAAREALEKVRVVSRSSQEAMRDALYAMRVQQEEILTLRKQLARGVCEQ